MIFLQIALGLTAGLAGLGYAAAAKTGTSREDMSELLLVIAVAVGFLALTMRP